MADGITELAMLLKERENKPPVAYVMGTVKNIGPLVIAPEGINFSLNDDDLVLPERLTERDEEVKINEQPVTIHHDGLKPGDRVVLFPSKDGQEYFVMDKVVL